MIIRYYTYWTYCTNKGLGFTIRGGIDYVHVGDDPGIFVTSIKPNGAAARSGRIGPGDKILEVLFKFRVQVVSILVALFF